MSLYRIVLSDLHLGTGTRRGQLNPLEDFIHDDRLVELLAYYDELAGPEGSIERILNGDIFDLLKVKIADQWPTEVTEEIAIAKLQQCLDGHPKFVLALREFMQKPTNRLTYLPGNHDLELHWPGVQAELMHTMGGVYLGLGLYAQAQPLLERALEIRRRLLGDRHPDTLRSITSMGGLARARGQLDEAQAYYTDLARNVYGFFFNIGIA